MIPRRLASDLSLIFQTRPAPTSGRAEVLLLNQSDLVDAQPEPVLGIRIKGSGPCLHLGTTFFFGGGWGAGALTVPLIHPAEHLAMSR